MRKEKRRSGPALRCPRGYCAATVGGLRSGLLSASQ